MNTEHKKRAAKIAFLGSGNMAEAIIKGILDAGLYQVEDLLASDLSLKRLQELHAVYGIRTTSSNREAVREAEVIFIGVKPLAVDAILAEIRTELGQKLLISIAAGMPISRIASELAREARIIRAMPNAPAKVQSGATVLSPGKGVEKEAIDLALRIFSAIGKSWVLEEIHLDAVTGLSGSGPAFVFIMIEALSDGGVKMGLPREVATSLAAQTVLGAAKMVLESKEHPARLKDFVASPGGTTISGLHQLESGNVRAALMSAVEAATERSIALGKQA